MIDFSPVYTTGLIVNCKTLEDSIALFEDLLAEFPKYHRNFSAFTPSLLNDFHERKMDSAAYRLRMTEGGLIVRKDRIDWYRAQSHFKDYVFVEYSWAHIAPLDDSFDEVDILSLLEGGETHA